MQLLACGHAWATRWLPRHLALARRGWAALLRLPLRALRPTYRFIRRKIRTRLWRAPLTISTRPQGLQMRGPRASFHQLDRLKNWRVRSAVGGDL
jgi:hypothetical protein